MMFMSGTRHILSNCLLTCGTGVWLGTSGVVALMNCTSPFKFCCISHNFAIEGRSVTLLMDRGSTSLHIFGLIKATRPPHKMRESMRQICALGQDEANVCLVLSPALHHYSLW